MAIRNADKIKARRTECSAALAAAMRAQDEQALDAALTDYSDFLSETLREEAEAAGGQAMDTVVLASRGVRQLTQQETAFYTKFIEAAKSPDYKNSIQNLDVAIPATIIDSVLEDVRKAHPLLEKINFINAGLFTKYTYNKSGKPTIVWGAINSAITNELSADIGVIDMTLCKLSAFIYVPMDMLDYGPQWVDRFVRELLAEYIAIGSESAIVSGDGKETFIGMTKDISSSASVQGGKYPDKTPVAITEITPASIGGVLATIAKNIDGTARPLSDLIFVVNPFDYFNKVMPATTVRAADGTYRNDVLPYPMTIIQSEAIEAGKAVIGLPKRYVAGVGINKDGKIEYSDEYKFLEDQRTYKVKMHGNGRALDENAFVLLDISGLVPSALEVKVVNAEEFKAGE